MNLDESSEETGAVSWAGGKLVTVDPTGISATTVGIAVGVSAATVGRCFAIAISRIVFAISQSAFAMLFQIAMTVCHS